jgi:hypothetical protein
MNDHSELVEKLHREAVERSGPQPPPTVGATTIHFSELPAAAPDSPLFREWNTYRHEVARLLAEGNAGRHILIKDGQIVGIWGTHDEAMCAGYDRFLGQSFLVHQIQERERVLRCGSNHRWHN